MKNLDNFKAIKQLDQSNVAQSISWLARQGQQAWQEVKKIKIPPSYRRVDNIVVNGMGGSALGSHIFRSLFTDELNLPMRIIHSYTLPAAVNQKTLYIVSSYSGTTEEPLATIKPALKKKAKVLLISSGGKLKRIKEQNNLPGYIFEPRFNPCNQSRIGLGYLIFSQWALLKKIGLIRFNDIQARALFDFMEKLNNRFGIEIPTQNNLAKKLAQKLYNKISIVVAAEFLSGNAHTFANQINENAKNFSAYFLISELNHHLMEGLARPTSNSKNLHFIFFESRFYHPRNQFRCKITQNVLKKNQINFSRYISRGSDKFKQSFEILSLGSYISFYLAILNNFNPALIPWVDYFKRQLK